MSISGGTLSPTAEVLLLEADISDLGTLQAAARMGNHYAENPPNKVVAFAGINHGDVSDYVEIHSIKVEEFGAFLVGSGYAVSTSEVSRRTSDRLLVASYSDTASWDRSEITAVAEEEEYFTISREASPGNAAIYFEESDLSSQKFLAVLQGSVRQASHEASFSTGVGVDIDDGTNLIALRFLDDFESRRIGTLATSGSRAITSSFSVVDSTWDVTTPEILLIGDADQNFLEMFLSEDASISVASVRTSSFASPVPYPSVASSYAAPTIGAGFLDSVSGLDYGGSFTVTKFLLIPGLDLFLPNKAKEYSDDNGMNAVPSESSGNWSHWNLSTTGTGSPTPVDSIENPVWQITCAESTDTAFLFKYFPESIYLPNESGITVLAQIQVDSWNDQFGDKGTPRVPTCAFVAIDVGDGLFLQLQSVLSTGGEQYIFVSQDSQDYIEVLNQTEFGQKISYRMDLSTMHVFMVCHRPGDGVQVFIDFSDTASIDLTWEDRSAVRKGSDWLHAGTHTVAIGAIPVSELGESASLTMGMIGVSIGSGLDFVSTMLVDDSALEDSIYGASANIFVDVLDEDP